MPADGIFCPMTGVNVKLSILVALNEKSGELMPFGSGVKFFCVSINQLCVRMSVALSIRLTVTPLVTVIVGPGLESFQPGWSPTTSPFSQILTMLVGVEAWDAPTGLSSSPTVGLASPVVSTITSRKETERVLLSRPVGFIMVIAAAMVKSLPV